MGKGAVRREGDIIFFTLDAKHACSLPGTKILALFPKAVHTQTSLKSCPKQTQSVPPVQDIQRHKRPTENCLSTFSS